MKGIENMFAKDWKAFCYILKWFNATSDILTLEVWSIKKKGTFIKASPPIHKDSQKIFRYISSSRYSIIRISTNGTGFWTTW